MITQNKEAQRFIFSFDNHEAFIDYSMEEGKMFLTHSEVPIELRGKGVGRKLVESTFEFIEQNNIQAVAKCSYIQRIRERSEHWSSIIE